MSKHKAERNSGFARVSGGPMLVCHRRQQDTRMGPHSTANELYFSLTYCKTDISISHQRVKSLIWLISTINHTWVTLINMSNFLIWIQSVWVYIAISFKSFKHIGCIIRQLHSQLSHPSQLSIVISKLSHFFNHSSSVTSVVSKLVRSSFQTLHKFKQS